MKIGRLKGPMSRVMRNHTTIVSGLSTIILIGGGLTGCSNTSPTASDTDAFTMPTSTATAEPDFTGFESQDVGFETWRTLADAGDPEAQFMMGVFHENGQDVVADADTAFGWYELSANQGMPRPRTTSA